MPEPKTPPDTESGTQHLGAPQHVEPDVIHSPAPLTQVVTSAEYVEEDEHGGRPSRAALFLQLQGGLEAQLRAPGLPPTPPKQADSVAVVQDLALAKGKNLKYGTALRDVVVPVHHRLWPDS